MLLIYQLEWEIFGLMDPTMLPILGEIFMRIIVKLLMKLIRAEFWEHKYWPGELQSTMIILKIMFG